MFKRVKKAGRWAVQQYRYWVAGKAADVGDGKARRYAMEEYRRAWDSYWEVYDSTDADEEHEAKVLQEEMEQLEAFITRGPGTPFYAFNKTLKKPPMDA